MSTARDHDDRFRPSSNRRADALIAASGAHSSDKVIIAGAAQLDLLITLLKRGFADVACQSATLGPHSRAAETDVLMAPDVASEAALQRLLNHLGSALRPRGVLVLQAAEPRGFCSERRLRQLVFESGFSAVERLSGGTTGPLWCAHKRAAALVRAA